MVHLALTGKHLTFGQRLLSNTLVWGVPMATAELIGVPIKYWLWVVILALPFTTLGVVVWTLMEHGFFSALRNHKHRSESS